MQEGCKVASIGKGETYQVNFGVNITGSEEEATG